jgi:hypothetical protein
MPLLRMFYDNRLAKYWDASLDSSVDWTKDESIASLVFRSPEANFFDEGDAGLPNHISAFEHSCRQKLVFNTLSRRCDKPRIILQVPNEPGKSSSTQD